jgi:thiol-disulfide isomerase/thioredoxin
MGLNQKTHANLILGSRILLSVLFLLSAVAKLYPSPTFALTTFEVKQLLPMGFSESMAVYFSRTLIGCELALGILLLQPHYFKRLVLPMSFLILFVFSAHLTYELLASGNSGNCGCFGALLPMTPLQALIKNIIAMGIIGYVFKAADISKDKFNFSFVMALTFASILAIYLVAPMEAKAPIPVQQIEEEEEGDVTDATLNDQAAGVVLNTELQNDTNPKSENTAQLVEKVLEPTPKSSGFEMYFKGIDKGKKILCFFAPGCDHCQETAKELTQLKKTQPNFPKIKIIFMNEEAEKIPEFFEIAGSSYPHQIIDIGTFWKVLGNTKDTPGVLYLWNGNIMKEYDGINERKFVKSEFQKLVNKKYEDWK